MKLFLGLLGLVFAASAWPYNLSGGYKQNAKYIYHYEGRIRPSQVPLLQPQFVELFISCIVELHPLSMGKFILQISKYDLTARVSDPKYTDGPIDYKNYGEFASLSEHIKKPIKFTYHNGLVQKVFPMPGDAVFSINLKRGIINLFHVDILGKNLETKDEELFEKTEESIIGVCPTSYSVNKYKVISAKRAWTQIGYNITKVIIDNCTKSDVEVFNKVVPGPNKDPKTNPMKSTATIKYNILGSKLSFKIEEVHAVGIHVLYLTSKDGGSIDSVTDQRLKLMRREAETMSKSQISQIEHRCNLPFMLMMRVGSFGHMEQIPAQTETDKYNLVEFVFSKLAKFVAVLPALEQPWKVEISTVSEDLLEIVNVIRTADLIVHEKIWERCIANPIHMKWMSYMFSLCHTESCMSFMKEKMNTLPEELIAKYLFVAGYNGNPTMKMVEWMKDIVMLTKITKSAYLTKTAYLSATSLIKTWCKQNVCQKLWIDQILETAMQHILKNCTWEKDTCRPISNLTATAVLALAENVERPTLLPFLEQIVEKDTIPVEVRVKAVLAIRPLVKIIPTRVHIAMLRIFSNVTFDTEIRILCFAVIMDNPASHVILHIAQEMKREPSVFVRRFIYDKWIAMRYTKLSAPKIDTAIRLALEIFPKNRIPSRWTMSNCYHLYHHCKHWSVASLWRHEEIYKKNFMPTFINSRLHIDVLGRRVSLFEAQLRVQGLQEYLSNMMGPNGLLNEGEPLLTLLRRQSKLKPVSEKLEQLRQKIPTYSVPDEKLKIFSQFKIFDKIFHFGEQTMDSKFDLQKMLYSESLPRMLGMAHELQEGTEYKFSKPFIPFEAIYRMPTLIGVPMTCNLTSMLIPISVSKLTINTTPNLFSWKTMLSQKIDSIHVEAQQRLWAVLDVRGQINFRIPNLEVGGYMKTKTNISTNMKATVNYDVKMRTFKTEIDTPEDIREVFTMTRKSYHYFKSENWHHNKTNSENQKFDVSEFDLKESNNKESLEERFKRSDDSAWYEPTSDVKGEPFRNTRIRIIKKNEGTPGLDAKVPIDVTPAVTANTITPTVSTPVPSTAVTSSVTPVMPVPNSEVLEIPIELDQMKNIQVFGIKKGINEFSEQWTLKVNGKFISVVGNKLILSNQPTVFDVKFMGFNRRIVRISVPNQGFVTIPRNNPCLTMTKTKSDIGQLFIVTMVRPNIFKICAITHLVPSSVPKEWGVASQWELNKIEEMETLFQKEMVPLEMEDLDETEKIETNKQTARLTHWTIRNNFVCLTPFENKAAMSKIVPTTPLKQVLQKLAYTKGFCYGTSIGIKTCLYGYRLFPRPQFLSMLFAPMEYRWMMSPTTKGQMNKMQVKISIPDPASDPIVHLMTISWKTMNPEKKIKIKSTISKTKREMSVEVTPSDAKMTDFSKMCWNIAIKPDNMIFSISFDPQCTHKNLNIDIITAKTFPRFWMAFRMRYSTRFIPNYIMEALRTISMNIIEPWLQSTFYVHPAVHPRDAYMSMTKLKLHLTKNDTMRIHLKTAKNFYYLDDVKLPEVIESLPFGSNDIPLMMKWQNSLMTPHCMHKDRSFVTFDKKPFNFTLRGQCEHELLRMCDKRKSDIAITTRKVGETKKRAVTIVVESKTFEFIPEGEMHEQPTIVMNGIKREFAGTRHDINDPKTNKPWVSFIWEPTTKCITLIYYKYTLIVKLREAHVVTLTISPMFANKTCGLCGNFDGEMWNDFTIPEGKVVNDVTRPTAFYSQVKNSAETIFASNWITPGRKCTKGCPFARRFVKAYMPGKLCLTNYRVGQCAIPCRGTSDKEMVKIPLTCVPPLRFKELEKYIMYGTPMKWDHVTEMLMDLLIPKKCSCSC